MLYAGSDDGIYRLLNLGTAADSTPEKVLDAESVFRLRQFRGVDGLYATAESGLYHTIDGVEWRTLTHPAAKVYAVAASPAGDRLYTGTRPVRVYVADTGEMTPSDPDAWTERPGLRELGQRLDWGLERHDGLAQVRSLCTHPAAPDRLVAGVEVGGVHVSDDGGEHWTSRLIEGFNAPHTDDIHHLVMPEADTLVASTGSGLYRSTDVGRTWSRLDTGHRKRYFREAFVLDGQLYAGAAPSSSTSWESDPDHALFEAAPGETLTRIDSPVPEEHPIGWTAVDGDPVVATRPWSGQSRLQGASEAATCRWRGSRRERHGVTGRRRGTPIRVKDPTRTGWWFGRNPSSRGAQWG